MAEKTFSGKQPVFVVKQIPEGLDYQFFYDKELVAVDGAYRKCTTAQVVFFSRPQEQQNASLWRIATKNIVIHEPVTVAVSDRDALYDFPEVAAAIKAGAKELVMVGYDNLPSLESADIGKGITITKFKE